SLGERAVPADALYGVQTLRALENFDLEGDRLSDRPTFLAALAHVKAAAARANRELGGLDADVAEAVGAAAHQGPGGRRREQVPLPIVQGGGGTSTNMNVNEVLANVAGERLGGRRGAYDRVHPNDHVNHSQSTNDVLPTAEAIAVHVASREALAGLEHLRVAL